MFDILTSLWLNISQIFLFGVNNMDKDNNEIFRSVLELHFNLVGLDLTDEIFEKFVSTAIIDNNVDFKKMSPYYLVPQLAKDLPITSKKIDEELNRIYEKIANMGDDLNERGVSYFIACISIINTCLNLNLNGDIKEYEPFDYVLHFKRVSEIVYLVLSSLNKEKIDDVIKLSKAIIEYNIDNIRSNDLLLTTLILLSLQIDDDIDDSKIFINNTSKLDVNLLAKHIFNLSRISSSYDDNILDKKFNEFLNECLEKYYDEGFDEDFDDLVNGSKEELSLPKYSFKRLSYTKSKNINKNNR